MQTDIQTLDRTRLEELRQIVAEILEREPDEIADASDFSREYDADSMRAIEILSRIEKKYRVTIPQHQLPEMQNLLAVYQVVAKFAGWPN